MLINIITHFFLKIRQRYRKLVITDNLGMSNYTRSINFKKPLILICMQKMNFIFHVFNEILQ